MANKIKKIIQDEYCITFILITEPSNKYWWWQIEITDWDKYWGRYVSINDTTCSQFINDIDNANIGCSCFSFKTIKAALENLDLESEYNFVDEITELHDKGLHRECVFGCEMLGYTCGGTPEDNPFCTYYSTVNADGNEVSETTPRDLVTCYLDNVGAYYTIKDEWETGEGNYFLIAEDPFYSTIYVLRVKDNIIYNVYNDDVTTLD